MKEKTKILLCITKSNWGGAQKYVYNLAISMPEKIFDVAVVCGGNGDLVERLTRLNIRVIKIENLERQIGLQKDIGSISKFIQLLKIEKPDIVHLNSSKMGFLGSLAVLYLNTINKTKNLFLKNKIKKIRTVFTAHGWAFNEDRTTIEKILYKILHKKTVNWTDKTITVSNSVRDQIIDKKNIDKLVTIYNGIEQISYKTKKKAREEISAILKNKSSEKIKWIGTISELHKNKGLRYAIEAFRKIKDKSSNKDCKFFIIGEGEERKNIEKIISDYRLQEDIFLLGHIPNAKELLKAFDIFTLTSITEAFPYVLLEAGQAELPILASAVGGIPEIIDDEIDGLLSKPRDSREISIMLEYLISNKEKRLSLGKKIKEKVLKKFSIRESVKKTFDLYNRLTQQL